MVEALASLMFLTEERYRRINLWTLIDSRKQKSYIKMEYTESPTVYIEAIIITLAIEAHKRRDIHTGSIPAHGVRQVINHDF